MKNGKAFLVESVVRKRYAQSAKKKEKALCCPVAYDPKYLEVIPREILEKDYGCGDPTPYVHKGDVVLDLGCGAGKLCYIASQIVGPRGEVIGVDFNPPMLALARKYQKGIGERIGWHNVEFREAKIQDLEAAGLAEESVDILLSNCVLNLVRPEDRKILFKEMHRVLKKGGRAAVSDIVSDEPVPEELKRDAKLWSGCISGAFQEKEFLTAFEEAGFYGLTVEKRDEKPWRIVRGIEFRSVTVTALKGKEGPCWERNQAVIYRGPWRQVEDDDHHVLRRGLPTAVCDKTYQIFSKEPYRRDVLLVPPRREILLAQAGAFDCSRNPERDPRETKGRRYRKTMKRASTCMQGSCC